MIDQLREQIQKRLDELVAEAERLRHALAALGQSPGPAPARVRRAAGAAGSRGVRAVAEAAAPRRPRRRRPTVEQPTAAPAPASEASPSEPAAAPEPSSRPRAPRAARARRAQTPPSPSTARAASGETKAAVLAALAGGEAMTAGQVAEKAGLARPTVSTTLTKLVKSGEVQKAERGYRLGGAAAQTPPSSPSAE